MCDGSTVASATYASLYAAIGTAFGGDATNFALPDLRDRFPLGKGTNNSTLGTQTGSVSASSVVTTASDGDGDLTVSTTSVAASAKDSTTTTACNRSKSSFTYTSVTVPSSVINYIIKT